MDEILLKINAFGIPMIIICWHCTHHRNANRHLTTAAMTAAAASQRSEIGNMMFAPVTFNGKQQTKQHQL